MQRYAATLLILIFALLGGYGGFNLLIDPYDIVGGPAIDGVNARKTRLREDGGRITASHRIAAGGLGSAVFGSSRTVDGFPTTIDTWPGGMTNVGMRGSNAFELARAITLAARDPDFRCAVVGVDMDEFGDHAKSRATYWLTPLPDGSRMLSLARVALSPNSIARSVQTLTDNLTGAEADTPWREAYEPGEQRGRYTGAIPGSFAYANTYQFDPERLEYFEAALDRLTAQGVQVTGFVHPLHAWREEILFRAGREEDFFAFRREMAALFDRYADRPAAQPCIEGGAAVLWDFSGFQDISGLPAPGEAETVPHAAFYEPSHYLPEVGLAMLDRMRGETGEALYAAERFGLRLTGEIARDSEEAVRGRREAWRAREDNDVLNTALDALVSEGRAYQPEKRLFLTRDDWRELRRDLARVPPRRAAGLPGDERTR
jgi:hypothetical protein